MPTYEYRVSNSDGETSKGSREADSRGDALGALTKEGYKVLAINEKKDKKLGGFFQKKVKLSDLVLFTRQLSTMVSAGVPLLRALDTLQSQTESERLKVVVGEIMKDVEGGMQLADSLEKHPDVFSDIYVNMVRAGEASGIVDDILKRLASQVEKTASMRKKIKGAMAYPLVLLSITVLAFFGLTLFVIPEIGVILKGLSPNSDLPPLTQGLLDMSTFMTSYWYILIILAVVGFVAFKKYNATKDGKRRIHGIILRLPVIGMLTTKIAVASFTRTFSALTGAGVSVVESLKVTSRSLGNVHFQDELEKAALDVVNGKQLSESLTGSKLFPAIVSQMLAVGEETGQTDVVLLKVAEFYEEEVDTAIDSLSSLLEPIMIVLMGSVVGIIAIAVIGPISSLGQNIE